MTRVLQPELLDNLAPSDPHAIHSRRDLRRLNSLMGNRRLIVNVLRRQRLPDPLRIAEIGAGDGNVSMEIARAFPHAQITLVDRHPATNDARFQIVEADVFDWLEGAAHTPIIIANLFLHHFDDADLKRLLAQCALKCDCFISAEPRRNSFAAWFARRVSLIGCNEVTLHDAEISVRAGFNGAELTNLWPSASQWSVTEKRAGLFTHFFAAARSR